MCLTTTDISLVLPIFPSNDCRLPISCRLLLISDISAIYRIFLSLVVTDRCEVYEDNQDCENEKGVDESDGDEDVQVDGHVSSFLTLHQLMKNEQGRYVFVDVPSSDVSNNTDPKNLEER